MAKKRKYKKKSFLSKHKEIYGIILIVISAIGIGSILTKEHFGPVGAFFTGSFIFVFGKYFPLIYILMLLLGIYIIFRKDKLKLFNIKFIGIYTAITGALLLTQINFTKDFSNKESFISVVDSFKAAIKGDFVVSSSGILGHIYMLIFKTLFSSIGAKVLAIILIILGMSLTFNLPNIIKIIIERINDIRLKKKMNKMIEKSSSPQQSGDSKRLVDKSELMSKASTEVPIHVEQVPSPKMFKHSDYVLPNYKELLNVKQKVNVNESKQNIKYNIERLEKVLLDFDVVAKVVDVSVGPSVTLYEMELKSGTKLNKVLGITREISLALAAKNVRIQAPIPGKNTIGIELPNMQNTIVTLREVFEDIPANKANNKLFVGLGKNIMGKTVFMEINNTPHLLVAGATGSGKSCCINSIITTILLRATPDEVQLVLIDPKKVEMSAYQKIPHLKMPVITDPRKASIALKRMVEEMDRRYSLFNETKTKSIDDYNLFVGTKNKNKEYEHIPYIVVIIDELADLMLIAAKEVEDSILRITQMARAAGIHLIVATQRPSVDIITGLVKSNIPSRISFAVSSSVDSRTILDMLGAEKLLGKGDMLFLPMGENIPVRIQGAYITDKEIQNIVDYTTKQRGVSFDEENLNNEQELIEETNVDEDDPLYVEVLDFILERGSASASLIQRRFRMGYNRAARIIDVLEERGVIGPPQGSKPREVLVDIKKENN